MMVSYKNTKGSIVHISPNLLSCIKMQTRDVCEYSFRIFFLIYTILNEKNTAQRICNISLVQLIVIGTFCNLLERFK